MILPTPGRVVWYHASQARPRLAAMIAFVNEDGSVNLAYFTETGVASNAERILLYQGEGERPDGEFCEWMPYQLGQAAKELHPVSASHWGLQP